MLGCGISRRLVRYIYDLNEITYVSRGDTGKLNDVVQGG
jgi:hypothetical protein